MDKVSNKIQHYFLMLCHGIHLSKFPSSFILLIFKKVLCLRQSILWLRFREHWKGDKKTIFPFQVLKVGFFRRSNHAKLSQSHPFMFNVYAFYSKWNIFTIERNKVCCRNYICKKEISNNLKWISLMINIKRLWKHIQDKN